MIPRISPTTGLTLYPVFDRHGNVRWVAIPKGEPPSRPARSTARSRESQPAHTGEGRYPVRS